MKDSKKSRQTTFKSYGSKSSFLGCFLRTNHIPHVLFYVGKTTSSNCSRYTVTSRCRQQNPWTEGVTNINYLSSSSGSEPRTPTLDVSSCGHIRYSERTDFFGSTTYICLCIIEYDDVTKKYTSESTKIRFVRLPMRDDHLLYLTHPIPTRPPTGGPSSSRICPWRLDPT